MEFTVYHNSFEVLGGSERVAVSVINVLKYLGYKVKLVTLYIDKEKVRKWDEHFVDPDEIVVKSFPVKFGLYKALYLSLNSKPGNSISTIGDITFCDYSYIHFPWSLTDNLRRMGFSEYDYSRGKMRIYYLPYKYTYKLFFRKSKSRLLANSSWTGKILELSGYSYTVLYPPVNVEKFINIKSKERNPKLVVSVSRISPEKNLENLFYVAKKLKDYEFILLGSSGRSKKYYEYVIKEAENLGNVRVISDFSDDILLKYFSEAKVYFHPKVNEHFGISVVEAIASGLVPVVHKSGGAWFDIVKEGKYGLGYSSGDEAVNAILEGSKYENDFRDVSNDFSFERFRDRFSSILR
ncbi:glycosyltransferase [Acidianus manzaensis]|uniref:Glycosyl transferase family 1 domain-containing protein n=1 Tax=Acidianus manzaensis TaxID=282676 RepID=A0A1W6K280_9CREN|nr:glycosyltransferase [Acidianus manzaensis]ARM76597.1 hypothetical protein B6F84_11585 [Acidianus manzaensis]